MFMHTVDTWGDGLRRERYVDVPQMLREQNQDDESCPEGTEATAYMKHCIQCHFLLFSLARKYRATHHQQPSSYGD